jgi:cholesterol oxidase
VSHGDTVWNLIEIKPAGQVRAMLCRVPGPLTEAAEYDVVVIGSGYGGAVVAARVAEHARVLVVERGRRWQPGEFPRGLLGLARASLGARNPHGLWAVRLGAGTGVGFASALGGSSPVNYGICMEPEVHALTGWPVSAADLAPYFRRARQALSPEPNPIGDFLGDKQFFDLVEPGRRIDIENTIDWKVCDQCGRCVPGCNLGAKRSLETTYLATATRAGAEISVETTVERIERREGGGWGVALARTGSGTASRRLRAARVVIAAGTLGTLDLVHRSRTGLFVGPLFGQGMSLNGDGLAFLYDTSYRLSSHSGAPISTAVRLPLHAADGSTRTLTVMSGRVPMAAMRFTGAALAVLAETVRERDDAGLDRHRHPHWIRRLRDLIGVDERGALSRSFMYKLDGQDAGRGTARFTSTGVVIDWPDYARDPILLFAERRLRDWATRVGGTVVPNLAHLPGMRSFSVHPLGGCRMGRSLADGVVDDVGRVFDANGAIQPGLRIADGSILPGRPGVPPSLTIAALAERIADSLVAEITASRGRSR